jgi:hypothetical protein
MYFRRRFHKNKRQIIGYWFASQSGGEMPGLSKRAKEELERIQRGKDQRMSAFKEIDRQLRKRAVSLDRRSTAMRVAIIVLGALVAVKSVVDQLMKDSGADTTISMLIQISFLIIGIAISVLAGLQAAFKYEEKAAHLKELANRALGLSAEYMTKFDKPTALADMWAEIESATQELIKLLDDVSQANVILDESERISFDLQSYIAPA